MPNTGLRCIHSVTQTLPSLFNNFSHRFVHNLFANFYLTIRMPPKNLDQTCKCTVLICNNLLLVTYYILVELNGPVSTEYSIYCFEVRIVYLLGNCPFVLLVVECCQVCLLPPYLYLKSCWAEELPQPLSLQNQKLMGYWTQQKWMK